MKVSNDMVDLEAYTELDPIVLVCASDNKYAMPMAVMVRSVIDNLNNESSRVILFVLDGGISNKNKQKIAKSLNAAKCEIIYLAKPDFLIKDIESAHQYCVDKGIESKTHLSIAAYYRLLIAELLPKNFSKVIYLDCDLVVKGDLENLWRMDIADNYVLAVPDMWINSVSAHNGLLNYRELGIKSEAKYFNSGVLVINMERWRDDKIFSQAIDYFKKNKSYVRFHDQDILNALLAGKWSEVDPRWNVTPGIYEYACWEESPFTEDVYTQLINEPYIIHFAAGDKPWNSQKTLMKEHFFHYVDMTEWSGWRFNFWEQLKLKISYKFKKLKSKLTIN